MNYLFAPDSIVPKRKPSSGETHGPLRKSGWWGLSSKSYWNGACLLGSCAFGLLLGGILLGCGGGGESGAAPQPNAPNNSAISGTIMGGRQPIVGSKVYVFDASGNSNVAPMQIASATTGSNGTFSITSFTTPPSNGDLIYVVALGGDAGGGTNANASLMSVAGVWGSGGFANNVQVNELTTVASASQLVNVMAQVSCTSIAGSTATSGTCPSIRGEAAYWSALVAAIANLVDVNTGQAAAALQTASNPSPAYSSYTSLNLQASELANCINSSGGAAGDSSACGNLFNLAAINAAAGTLTALGSPLSTGFSLPTSLAISPNGLFMYEMGQGLSSSMFGIESNGTLTPLGSLPSPPFPNGFGPTTIAVSPDNQFVYMLDYTSTISTFGIDSNGVSSTVGSPVTVNPMTLAFSLVISSNGQFAYVTFENGTVSTFSIGGDGSLTPVGSPTPVGTHPLTDLAYGIAISPNGQFAYVGNAGNGTISTFSIGSNGALSLVGSPISSGTGSNIPTSIAISIAISPNGQYAYVVNRIDGTVSTFSIRGDGSLTLVGSPIFSGTGSGSSPISIAISPNGQFAYVTNTGTGDGTISTFSIGSNGALSPVGLPILSGTSLGSSPTSVTISPNGRFLYTANYYDSTISTFAIASGTTTDTLSAVLNLQANSTNAAAALFALPLSAAVYAPLPSLAPATLKLP